MRISAHITYAEAIHSNTAKRKRIDNTPNPTQVEAMKLTAEKVFEPLRSWVGGPIKVNSFFRSPVLINARHHQFSKRAPQNRPESQKTSRAQLSKHSRSQHQQEARTVELSHHLEAV